MVFAHWLSDGADCKRCSQGRPLPYFSTIHRMLEIPCGNRAATLHSMLRSFGRDKNPGLKMLRIFLTPFKSLPLNADGGIRFSRVESRSRLDRRLLALRRKTRGGEIIHRMISLSALQIPSSECR
ncbi:MAG: hypothetical protein K6G56_01220, partial [Clostridiales bacterium]|nr:hypothetical protein [Clostridiales bacterium]